MKNIEPGQVYKTKYDIQPMKEVSTDLISLTNWLLSKNTRFIVLKYDPPNIKILTENGKVCWIYDFVIFEKLES